MSTPPKSFKKKLTFDFSDNAMMTSSVKAPNYPSRDESYLVLQNELKRVKQDYNELSSRYDEMSDYNISERVELELELQYAEQQISNLKQERQLLRARIRALQKECSQMGRSYQKPLNRSIVKSGLKRSTLGNQNTHNIFKSQVSPTKTDRSYNSRTSLKQMLREKDLYQDDSELNDLQFTQDNISNTVKFDKNWNQREPLIDDDNSSDSCQGCGNKKCLDNYTQLQYLRESIIQLTDKLEDVFLKLGFQVQRKLNQKNIAVHKQNLEALWKQSYGSDFFYKDKPSYMISKIQEKLKDFTETQSYQNYNPMLRKMKQKMKQIKSQSEALRKEDTRELFNQEQAQRDILKIIKKNDDQFRRYEQMLERFNIKDPKFEQLRKRQKTFAKNEFKKAGIHLKN